MTLPRHSTLLALVFILTGLVYRLSPVSQVYDSRYSVLLSETLLHHHTFDLAKTSPAAAPLLYQLRPLGPHIYYFYPPGTPLLTIPFIAAFNALGLSTTPDGTYRFTAELSIQRTLAALATAATVIILLALALRFATRNRALLLALLTAFGTSFWSTASRALWSQTTETLLLSAALLVLTGNRPRSSARSLFLGTLLGWMYVTRPAAAISIAAILAYLAVTDRRQFLLTAATAAAWFLAFLAWSQRLYHAWQPPYYTTPLTFDHFFVAFVGQLVSPSRGLFIFTPWLLVIPALLLRFRRHLSNKPLVLTALAAVVLHTLVISAWDMWWFGHCFGPRAFLDVLPWFILLAALALAAIPTPAMFHHLTLTLAAFLAVASIVFHAQGALSVRALAWNASPANIDSHPARLWDWSDPQFLAGFLPRRGTQPPSSSPIDAPLPPR